MKNFKWGTISFCDQPIHVVLFVSRKKDNTCFEDFVERRISFITHDTLDSESLQRKFSDFVNAGQPGEMSRLYYSVNERDGEKIYKALLHFLIDNPEFNLCSIGSKLAGIAATKECAKTKRWMFDFDINDENKVKEFCEDIANIDSEVKVILLKTPHGYAVITSRGFDTRELMKKWDQEDIALKRDDLLCAYWKTKSNFIVKGD